MGSELQKIRDSLESFISIPADQARTPDFFHYYSPEVYELEIEHIWKKEWIAVGHIAWLKERGDYFAWDILDEPIVVVRGLDGKIRALSSICRHRAVPLTQDGEQGNLKSFQCPYHLWTFELNGQLKGAPYMEDNKAFDKSAIALPEFRLEIWSGIIFINFDDDAPPLAPQLAGLNEAFRFCDRDELVSPNRHIGIWQANWKQAMENGDVYHGPGVHPEAMNYYDSLSTTRPTTQGECWARQIIGLDPDWAKTLGFVPGKDEISMVGRTRPQFEMGLATPATFLMIDPHGLQLQLNWPISVDATRVIMFTVSRPEIAVPKLTPEQLADPKGPNMVNLQDSIIFDRAINRSVRSSRAEAGLMSVIQEGPAFAIHQKNARRLLAGINGAC